MRRSEQGEGGFLFKGGQDGTLERHSPFASLGRIVRRECSKNGEMKKSTKRDPYCTTVFLSPSVVQITQGLRGPKTRRKEGRGKPPR